MTLSHRFFALAFLENFSLRELASVFPEARPGVQALRLDVDGGGELHLYPFGAMVFMDVPSDRREIEIARLRRVRVTLTADVVREDFTVHVEEGTETRVAAGALQIDHLTPERAGVVALTVAQSAAMETYERIVEQMFVRTQELVGGLERRGTVGLRTRPLHRFIAEAIASRNEVLTVMHLLDRPDAVWDDRAMDDIYEDLRGEFDLADRYEALELKLRAVQESLQLVLETARDRRLILLEVAVVLLIVVELSLSLLRIR